jgi:hypothetical protein
MMYFLRRVYFFFLVPGILLGSFLLHSCKISYSFKGTTIDPRIKSYSVANFNNRAPLVQPRLTQFITDELKDKIQNQTNLKLVNGFADVEFSGDITNYETRPVAITGQATTQSPPTAALNRFTISVKVRYNNTINPELSYEQAFSKYEDYPSSQNLSTVEEDLSRKIVESIIEDIFNRAFVNW